MRDHPDSRPGKTVRPASRTAAHGEEHDDELLARVAKGDATAWPLLVDRHLVPVVGFAWRLTRNRTDAEDVGQETFVRLMRKAGDWQPGDASLRTWLYRVATNLCIDRHRAANRMPVASETEIDSGAEETADFTRDIDIARAVQRAVDRLPERQRRALTLVHYQGLSNGEAADVLEISVDACESLLARARRALKADLRDEAADLLGED